jgi:hypothetical protein
MNVNETENTNQAEVRHTLAITDVPIRGNKQRMPKQPTARMKIINGRPYYYEVENVWDRKEQRCRQKSKYLGKELPRGYRLIK